MPQIISRKEAKALGLKRYFTGKPCKHGHISEHYSRNGECVECALRRQQLPQTIARRRRYYEENKEQILSQQAKYHLANRDERCRRMRDYGKRPEKRQLINAAQSRWMKRNPAKVNAKLQARRAKMHGDTTKLSDMEKQLLLDVYAECSRLNALHGRDSFHVDHIIPIALGGKHHPDNLQILSAYQNRAKGSKLPQQLAA